MQETWVRKMTWVRKISWRRKWQPTPVFLLGESHGQEELGRLQSMGSQRDTTEIHLPLALGHMNMHTPKRKVWDFPGGPVVRSRRLPKQGTRVQSLVWKDPQCCRATESVSHSS